MNTSLNARCAPRVDLKSWCLWLGQSCLCLAALFGLLLSSDAARAEDAQAELERLRAEVKALKEELSRRPRSPGDYPVPKQLRFCGELIDLSPPEVRRRFKEELTQVLDQRRLMSNVLKRARLIFPVIEREAGKVNGCADLRHLAVAESALRAGAVSPAGAQGWWQFISSTATQYKLTITPSYDARRDLILSTRTAFKYLNVLHKAFGTWPLAMASYNAGRGRVRSARRRQGQQGYWDLDLPREAERYVPRILALHYVMTHLEDHDFRPTLDSSPPPALVGLRLKLRRSSFVEKVKVKPPKSRRAKKGRRAKATSSNKTKRGAKARYIYRPSAQVSLSQVSQVIGLALINMRHHNPALTSDHLPLDTSFIIWLPPSGVEPLKRHLRRGLISHEDIGPLYVRKGSDLLVKRAPDAEPRSAPPSPPHRYKVRPGDSLFLISARFGVSVEDLRSWNELTSSSPLRLGDSLSLTQP